MFTREAAVAPRRMSFFAARTLFVGALFGLTLTAWQLLVGSQRLDSIGDLAWFGAACGIGTVAIAEQYIEGRELYVGVLGNDRLRVLPIWELEFKHLAQGTRAIATEKVKHDADYQERQPQKADRDPHHEMRPGLSLEA